MGGDGITCFPLVGVVARFDVGLSGARFFGLSVTVVGLLSFFRVFFGFGACEFNVGLSRVEAGFDVGLSRAVVGGILSLSFFRVFFAFGACKALPMWLVLDVRVIRAR